MPSPSPSSLMCRSSSPTEASCSRSTGTWAGVFAPLDRTRRRSGARRRSRADATHRSPRRRRGRARETGATAMGEPVACRYDARRWIRPGTLRAAIGCPGSGGGVAGRELAAPGRSVALRESVTGGPQMRSRRGVRAATKGWSSPSQPSAGLPWISTSSIEGDPRYDSP